MTAKEKQAIYDKRSRAKHLEKRLERDRLYSKKNRAKKTEYCRKWRAANPDKIKASNKRNSEYQKRWADENKDRVRASQKVWRERNRHKINEQTARRAHALLLATPKWLSKVQKQQILSYYRSAHVAEEFHEIPYHVDHIEPLRGRRSMGLHVPWNLQIIPALENVKKSNKLIVST